MLDPFLSLILDDERPEKNARPETGATISGEIALASTRHGASHDLRRSWFPMSIQGFIGRPAGGR
jgi:hypothetical protein